MKCSHLEERVGVLDEEKSMRWSCVPLIPTLIGAIALLNVASVVMALAE